MLKSRRFKTAHRERHKVSAMLSWWDEQWKSILTSSSKEINLSCWEQWEKQRTVEYERKTLFELLFSIYHFAYSLMIFALFECGVRSCEAWKSSSWDRWSRLWFLKLSDTHRNVHILEKIYGMILKIFSFLSLIFHRIEFNISHSQKLQIEFSPIVAMKY